MSARILILTPDLPYPPSQGAAIRSLNLIRNLSNSHEIHLLSFIREGERPGTIGPLSRYCSNVATVPSVSRSTGRRALSTLFSAKPDMALRLPSVRFADRLRMCLDRERFGFVQVEAIEMGQYGLAIKRMSLPSPPVVVFDDINAEYLLQRRAFETDMRHPTRWLGALYSLIQWQKLRHYEAEVCRQVDRVIVVSEADRKALERIVPGLESTVVPNGVDSDYFRPHDTDEECDSSFVFTGKMDFRPNVDAVLWFTREVWSLIRSEIPQAQFKVVGRDPHARLKALERVSGVTLTGWVEDVRPHIAEAGVYVVPLRVGGGTRLKVLEAMSMGKAIVSTSQGCEGIDVTPDRHLVIADEPASFAKRVVDLARNPQRRRRIGQAARALAATRYDWQQITPALERLYES